MHVHEALETRHSTRSFSDQPLDPHTLNLILDSAALSPSWSNTHPYRLAVATGQTTETLREALYIRYIRLCRLKRAGKWAQFKAWLRRDPCLPDPDFKPILNYPTDLQQRRFDCGMGLYKKLGIARDDFEARDDQMAENFRFFGAPVVVFIFCHKGLGSYSALDSGLFIQSLLLAATEEGVSSCAQGTLGLYRKPLEQHFKIPKHYQLLCGVSLGYENEERVNLFRPAKLASQDLILEPRGG